MRKWNVNITCLAGATLGAVALLLPWASTRHGSYYFPIDIFLGSDTFLLLDICIPMLIFFVAVMMTFITPLGSPIQLASVLMTLSNLDKYTYIPDYWHIHSNLPNLAIGPGIFVAFIAALISCFGLMVPRDLSSTIRRSDLSGRLLTFRPREFWNSSINLLCLVGVIVSILSLMLPWGLITPIDSQEPTYLYFPSYSLVDVFEQNPYSIFGIATLEKINGPSLQIFMLVFIIGTIIALITPLGGCPQLIGSSGYIITILDMQGDRFVVDTSPYLVAIYSHAGLSAGAILGFFGALSVVLSIVQPAGINRRTGSVRISDRLLTWGRSLPDAVRSSESV